MLKHRSPAEHPAGRGVVAGSAAVHRECRVRRAGGDPGQCTARRWAAWSPASLAQSHEPLRCAGSDSAASFKCSGRCWRRRVPPALGYGCQLLTRSNPSEAKSLA